MLACLENEDVTTSAVRGGLAELSVGAGDASRRLLPTGDEVQGVSLACADATALVDAALRLTPAGSEDHAFIAQVCIGQVCCCEAWL